MNPPPTLGVTEHIPPVAAVKPTNKPELEVGFTVTVEYLPLVAGLVKVITLTPLLIANVRVTEVAAE